MQTIAMEGRCFVIAAAQYLTIEDTPADYEPVQGRAADTVLINGGSMIVSPLGEILAGPVFGAETIVRAEIDLAAISRAKFDFDVTGHYARPDIFRMNINTQAQNAVTRDEPGD